MIPPCLVRFYNNLICHEIEISHKTTPRKSRKSVGITLLLGTLKKPLRFKCYCYCPLVLTYCNLFLSLPSHSVVVIAVAATCCLLVVAGQGGFRDGHRHRFYPHYPSFGRDVDVAQDPNTVDEDYGWSWGASQGDNQQQQNNKRDQYNPDFSFSSNEYSGGGGFNGAGQFQGGNFNGGGFFNPAGFQQQNGRNTIRSTTASPVVTAPVTSAPATTAPSNVAPGELQS